MSVPPGGGSAPNSPAGDPDPDGPFSGPIWQEGGPQIAPGLAGILGLPDPSTLIIDNFTEGTVLGHSAAWWQAFWASFLSWRNFAQSATGAWKGGYYSCIGNEMFPFKGLLAAAGAKAGEEAITETAGENASTIAGAYYHLTDGRFTAWGKYSKVLVPKAASGIETRLKWAKVGGWLVTDAELAHAEYTCRDRAR